MVQVPPVLIFRIDFHSLFICWLVSRGLLLKSRRVMTNFGEFAEGVRCLGDIMTDSFQTLWTSLILGLY